MGENLRAYYCFFAAWSVHKELVVIDEFYFEENESAARATFETSIRKKLGASWRETHSKNNVTIRDLTRIVDSMMKARDGKRDQAGDTDTSVLHLGRAEETGRFDGPDSAVVPIGGIDPG